MASDFGYGPVPNPGDGVANRAKAEHALSNDVPIAGTPAATYLCNRGIPDEFHPAALRYLPNARVGEGALVVPLSAGGNVVAVQLTYLDPLGRKSVMTPQRMRLNLAKTDEAAVFTIPAQGGDNPFSDILACEGLEDALSCALAAPERRRHRQFAPAERCQRHRNHRRARW